LQKVLIENMRLTDRKLTRNRLSGSLSSDRNATRIWLQLHSFLEFCVLCGSGICNSPTT
jgi:hypothetical protein